MIFCIHGGAGYEPNPVNGTFALKVGFTCSKTIGENYNE